jgi:hypothetical protein
MPHLSEASIFKTLIGPAVVASIVTIVIQYFLKERERKQHANYLAIRVVCMLDPFIEQCAKVAHDHGESPTQEDNPFDLRTTVSTPALALPNDVDWKSIDAGLVYRLLSFVNRIDRAERSIDATAYYDDNVAAIAERQRWYTEIGVYAADIAHELRTTFKIAPAIQDEGLTPLESLQGAKAKFAEAEERRRIEHERWLSSAPEPPPSSSAL